MIEVTEESKRRHLGALDGLRGLAVAAVVAFHLADLGNGERDGLLPGGWLGVDAFFTLSGYLITSLLLVEIGTHGRIDFRGFWRRRVRRLQPAALVTVAAVAATAPWWATAGTGRALRGDALAAVSGLANWRALWADQPYAAGASPSPLEHFWSLAVEEQFYLAWPLVVAAVALALRGQVRRVGLAVGLLAAAGAAASWAVLAGQDLQRGYLGTDGRVGSILAGASLAVLLPLATRQWSGRRAVVMAVAGVGAAAAMALLWWQAAWPLEGPLAPVLVGHALLTSTVIAAAVTVPGRGVGRLLDASPLRLLGRVSYGVYLWHWPVFVVLTPQRLGLDAGRAAVVRLAVVALLTTFSWYLVEHPVRIGAVLPHLRTALPAAIATVAALVVVGTQGVAPAPGWASADGRLVLQRSAPLSPGSPVVDAPAPAAAAAPGPTTAPTAVPTPEAVADPGAVARPPSRVLVVGDSVATSLLPGDAGRSLQVGDGRLLDQLGSRGITAASATLTGCPVAAQVIVVDDAPRPWCPDKLDEVLPHAVETVRPDLVVWYSRQEAYAFELPSGERMDPVEERAAADRLLERYVERIDWFAERGAKVALVSPGPNAHDNDGYAPSGSSRRSMRFLDGLLERVHAARPVAVVGVIRMGDLLCPSGSAVPCDDDMPGGGRYRPVDGLHFAGEGALRAGEWLADRIAALDLGA